jgi:hypothetical protein
MQQIEQRTVTDDAMTASGKDVEARRDDAMLPAIDM